MGTKIQTRRIMQNAVDTCKSFIRGNLSAKVFNQGEYLNHNQIGQLEDFLADQLNGRITDGSVYVVYSYQTPIGWCNTDGSPNWFIPDVKYSISTTHHQSLLMVMTSNKGFYELFGQYSPESTLVAMDIISEISTS